jgi:hypothetical protein
MLNVYLQTIDLVSDSVSLRHNKSDRLRSGLGGILTILIVIFLVYCINYFGEDIIKKEKPITTFSKAYQPSSKIYLNNTPVVMAFYNSLGKQYMNIEKYITFVAQRYYFEAGNIDYTYMNVEPCDEDRHLGGYKQLFRDNKINVTNGVYCLNSNTTRYKNGTVEEIPDIYFENENGAADSSLISTSIQTCKNTTSNPKCASKTDIDKVGNDLFIMAYAVDGYVDLSDYSNPYKQYLQSLLINISPTVIKATHIMMKNTYITTDSGIIMEDIAEQNIYQIESSKTDVVTSPYVFYSYYLESTRITDRYFRRYVKIQDLVANIGGLIRCLFMVSTMLTTFFSESKLFLDIANSLYTFTKDDSRSDNIKNSAANMLPNELKFAGNSVIIHPKRIITNEIKPPDSIDYYKSLLCCYRSMYTKSGYHKLRDMIHSRFELSYLFKQLQDLQNFMNMTLDERKKPAVTAKRTIRMLSKEIVEETVNIPSTPDVNVQSINH